MIDPSHPDFQELPIPGHAPALPYYPSADRPGSVVVSILTPFFNTDAVFLETAASILSQSFQAWEWIVVDDGSTSPEALALLDAVTARDPRIRKIVQPNAGPAAARNTAFAHSTGRYLFLLDSDDLVEPTYVEKCVWFLESQPAFGFCNAYSVIFGAENYLWTTGFEQGRNHLHANSGPPISVLRRETYAASGGFDETITFGHEDWDFWLRIASKGIWGYTIPEFLQWYRKRSSGRFTQVMSSPERHAAFEQLMRERYADALEVFPEPRLRSTAHYEDVSFDVPFENPSGAGDRKPSILFLFPWLVTGGADRVNLDWIDALRRADWRVCVCSTLESHNDWHHEFARLTPDVFVLNRFLHRTDYLRFVEYLVVSRRVDVVAVSGSTLGYLMLPYLRARFPGVAFIDVCHVEEPHWANGGHPRFGAGYQSAMHLNVVTTAHLKNWMVGRGASADDIAVCHTGADVPEPLAPDVRAAVRAEFGALEKQPLIVFAGRLCAQKRPLLLLDILADLKARGLDFRAVVVGDGELRKDVEAHADALGVRSHVLLAGALPHHRWIDLLSSADLLLMPSAYEGISVALYEAMARGVVPVVGLVGGQDEVVDAASGTLIAPSDHERLSYTAGVARYLEDPALLAASSTHARDRIVAHFTKAAGADAFRQTLEKVIARARASVDGPAFIPMPLAREMAVQGFEYVRMAGLADLLWSQRSGPLPPEPSGLLTAAPVSPALRRVSKLLVRIRASRYGASLSRFRFLRISGRRLIEWLERKPGF